MGECEELAVPVVSRASGWIRRPVSVIHRVSGLVVPVGDRLKGWALKQVEWANAESGSGQVHGAGSAETPPRLTRGAHEFSRANTKRWANLSNFPSNNQLSLL